MVWWQLCQLCTDIPNNICNASVFFVLYVKVELNVPESYKMHDFDIVSCSNVIDEWMALTETKKYIFIIQLNEKDL